MKKQMLYRKHKHDINSDNTEQQVNCYDNEIHSHTVSDIVSQKENKNALNLKTQYNEYIQHQYKISELFGGSNDNTNNNSKHIQITRNNNNNRQNKKKGIFTLSPPKEKVHKKDRILLSNLLLSSQRLFSNNYSSQTSIEKEQIFQRNLFKTQHSSVNSNEHILQHHQPIQNSKYYYY
jgi:hypothetical protein